MSTALDLIGLHSSGGTFFFFLTEVGQDIGDYWATSFLLIFYRGLPWKHVGMFQKEQDG